MFPSIKRLFAFIIILCSCTHTFGQPCPSNDLLLSSQIEVDAFATQYPLCTTISGSVSIKEAPGESISNLNGLSQITVIEGGLNISSNAGLRNLKGLGNLVSVGNSIRISDNRTLHDIEDFQRLTRVYGDLSITGNTTLTQLMGLQNLKFVKEHLIITGNPSLIHLQGLRNLDSIGRDFLLQDNRSLSSLEGLENLHAIHAHVVIDDNDKLTTMRGLNGLKTIGGNLQIVNNDNLINLIGLESLREMGGLLQVYNNLSLKSLVGIDSLQQEGILDLAILSSINLAGCSVKSICAYLRDPSHQASIRLNALGCGSRDEILEACDSGGPSSQPTVRGKSLFFPNPTSGILFLRDPILDGQFVATDMFGRKMSSGPVVDDQIDITPLSIGPYLIAVFNDEEIRKELVIKI